MDFLLNPLYGYEDLAILLARIILAVIMIYYGIPKLRNLKGNASDFVSMGFKPGWFWGTLIALLETGGSLLLLVGLFTGIIAVLFAIQMIVGTIWKITKTDKPFTDWSYDLTILAIAVFLAVYGGGSISLDAAFFL